MIAALLLAVAAWVVLLAVDSPAGNTVALGLALAGVGFWLGWGERWLLARRARRHAEAGSR